MKHVKLFESFLNEAKGAPNEVVALVKKIQLGSRAVGKEVTDKKTPHEPWTGKWSEDPWLSMLDQKLKGSFDFELNQEHDFGGSLQRRSYKINDYINMAIYRGPSSAYIDLQDRLTSKTIKKQEYFGTDEATTDAVATAISANMSLFNELKSAGTENTSMSMRKLNSDNVAGSVEKRLKGFSIDSYEAESIAHGILLKALDGLDPVDRAQGIQIIVNTLNTYLKDKDYMNLPSK